MCYGLCNLNIKRLSYTPGVQSRRMRCKYVNCWLDAIAVVHTCCCHWGLTKILVRETGMPLGCHSCMPRGVLAPSLGLLDLLKQRGNFISGVLIKRPLNCPCVRVPHVGEMFKYSSYTNADHSANGNVRTVLPHLRTLFTVPPPREQVAPRSKSVRNAHEIDNAEGKARPPRCAKHVKAAYSV